MMEMAREIHSHPEWLLNPDRPMQGSGAAYPAFFYDYRNKELRRYLVDFIRARLGEINYGGVFFDYIGRWALPNEVIALWEQKYPGTTYDDDATCSNYGYAKPYIIGYALAGLGELARYFPDEPKLRDVIQAVADFMAESQDPLGGWRYPHPRSSGLTLNQAMEHAWQIVQADRYLDFRRDYTEGRLGFGYSSPEGLVYFPDVLAFYLKHRPASRLLRPPTDEEPLGKVLARAPEK